MCSMCSPDTSFLATDAFYLNTLHILTAIEVPLHLFGAYIILAKTPPIMASVKSSMFVLHLLGAICDVYISLIASPVLMVPAVAGHPLGISLWLGIPTSVQVYIGFSMGCVVCSSVLVFFEDRLFVIRNRACQGRTWKRKLYALTMYLFAFTYIAPAFFAIPSSSDSKVSVMEKIPCLSVDRLDRQGFFLLTIDNTICIICFCTALFICITQLFALTICIIYRLSQNAAKSKHVARVQRQFFMALGLQVAIPIGIFGAPMSVMLYCIVNGAYNQAVTNISLATFASHGIASTITMLLVHTPYRNATLQVFGCGVKRKITIDDTRIWRTGSEACDLIA